MAAVATEMINGYAIRQEQDRGRGRREARMAAPMSREVSPLPRNSEFPRSASYTYLPDAKEPPYGQPAVVTIKGSFSEADLIAPADDIADISPPDSSGWTTPDEVVEPKVPFQESRDLIAALQKSPKISVARFGKTSDDDASSVESSIRRPSLSGSHFESASSTTTISTSATSVPVSVPSSKSRPTLSQRLSYKSWQGSSTSSSPSPSPPKKDHMARSQQSGNDAAPAPETVGGLISRKSFLKRRDTAKKVKDKLSEKATHKQSDSQNEELPTISRRSTLLKRKTRPVSGIFGSKDENAVPSKPVAPAVPSIPKSFSTDRLPEMRSHTQFDRAAPLPRLLSSERVPSSGISIPIRKKDELWGAFRGLDADFAKFSSKTVNFKANVVRSTLLPFLRTYATHSSNRTLRPEDLDRRANILNKWWTGLIELLHGRNNQSISGTDRPVILDGISGIMERPEWRLSPSPFCPIRQRTKPASSSRNQSTTSLSSSNSEFLIESVHHNVRNIFIQNLSAQMTFVVDKMSFRNASASLVTFCGKACAYAFVFVPGMADVLVRLWELPMDTLRRVLDENGIGKFDNISATTSTILSNFPPALQQLGFSSLMKYMRKLRTPPPLPLGTANVQWWGRWLERWTGRESDLFYVFVKHFHILVTDFLPLGATKPERVCAPGVLLVHAQILTNLDATIHRDASPVQSDPTAVGQSPTFDDVLGDPDAVASALPLPPTNAIRVMAENRLIMLIRDFLSDRTSEHPRSRQFFAEAFNDLLQCAARGTSIFDHAACYTLLDFLEEALVILVRFEHLQQNGGSLINSEFWQAVCKKMISSQNTMTEIRLYAFLFTVWNTVISDLGRKADLCLGLLLEPDVFESRFNHWCPMVRAYFMRLLCWRMARFDGEVTFGDVEIYETMLQRLQTVWCHYLHLREQAIKHRTLPPPTNPCNPAPGRRLLIVRTDTQVNPGSSFLSFDGLVNPSRSSPQSSPTTPTFNKRISSLSAMAEIETRPESTRSASDSETSSPQEKGFGGFLRKMMGSSKTRSKSQGPTPRATTPHPLGTPPVPDVPNGLTRSATQDLTITRSMSVSSASTIDKPTSQSTATTNAASANTHRNYCFKFSLEYHPNPKHVPGPIRLMPPRLPLPAQQCLIANGSSTSGQVAGVNTHPIEPRGDSCGRARYAGRALAEWTVVVGECQSFFERRRNEGAPANRFVETPMLGVEVFRRPS